MAIQKTQKEVYKPIKIIYTENDLAILDKKIRESYGGFKKIEMHDKYLVDNGCLKIQYIPRFERFILEPDVYRELENKLTQWHNWRQRQEFIEDKKIEGLEKIAEGMQVKNDFIPDNW